MVYNEVLTDFLAPFIHQLVLSGVQDVVISPGSRSTPLTVLFREHPDIKVWMNVDERSAGFFALGIAKGKQAPVALVCSSGTAAANFYPAIIEAKYSEVPLIVLTADRPHELREVGAPQAMDQIKLYGMHVKEFADLPIPEKSPVIMRYMAEQAAWAVNSAVEAPKGPVHLNFPFREPLMPDVTHRIEWDRLPSIRSHMSSKWISKTKINSLVQTLSSLKKPLIVVGTNLDVQLREAVYELAERLKAPILADPLSQLRSGPESKKWLIESYDAILREEAFVESYQADGIIRFGPIPVSKPLTKYIERLSLSTYVVVSEGGRRSDPTHQVTDWLTANPGQLIQVLSEQLNNTSQKVEPGWYKGWLTANDLTKNLTQDFISRSSWFEGHVITEMLNSLPDKSNVFVSNSMPIRDLDSFFESTIKNIQTFGNRGTNGIDGINSTALGISTNGDPTYLVVGDLAFFHDSNGLMVGKQYDLNLTVLIVNNNGGGIFSFLPQAKTAEHFEELFGTPLNLNVKDLAVLYKTAYFKATNPSELQNVLEEAQTVKGIKLIECVTTRSENVLIHQDYWEKVNLRLQSILGDVSN